MRRAAAVCVIGVALAGASSPPAERVVGGDGVVAMSVDGQHGRVRIDPAAPGVLLLAPDFAPGVKPNGHGLLAFGVVYNVGGENVYGPTKVVRFSIDAGKPGKRRVAWPKRAYAPGADGVIGPAGVDEPVVRFVLGPAHAGERTATLPMAEVGGLFSSWFGSFAEIEVGGQPMLVRFDPRRPRSMANARAAIRLSNVLGGKMEGATGRQEIAFGIERPVRGLALGRPLMIGPVALASLVVRTGEGGNTAAIPEAGAPVAVDPEEVVVTAKGKKHDPRNDRLTLGADQLGRCSSLVFDKRAKQVRLSCW